MRHFSIAAALKYIDKANNVRIYVSSRIVDEIPHPGLGAQMNDAFKLMLVKQFIYCCAVGQVEFNKRELTMGGACLKAPV
ncbi:MAG: hypothetical protein ACI9Y1_000225 [Lentisphaeria bacterium]